jgi:hypothetical protein
MDLSAGRHAIRNLSFSDIADLDRALALLDLSVEARMTLKGELLASGRLAMKAAIGGVLRPGQALEQKRDLATDSLLRQAGIDPQGAQGYTIAEVDKLLAASPIAHDAQQRMRVKNHLKGAGRLNDEAAPSPVDQERQQDLKDIQTMLKTLQQRTMGWAGNNVKAAGRSMQAKGVRVGDISSRACDKGC